jgi:hypothetical protein
MTEFSAALRAMMLELWGMPCKQIGAIDVTKLTEPGRLTAPMEVNAAMKIAKP